MKVRELISQLQSFDPDLEVMITDPELPVVVHPVHRKVHTEVYIPAKGKEREVVAIG
jgi:hypothetical protein